MLIFALDCGTICDPPFPRNATQRHSRGPRAVLTRGKYLTIIYSSRYLEPNRSIRQGPARSVYYLMLRTHVIIITRHESHFIRKLNARIIPDRTWSLVAKRPLVKKLRASSRLGPVKQAILKRTYTVMFMYNRMKNFKLKNYEKYFFSLFLNYLIYIHYRIY